MKIGIFWLKFHQNVPIGPTDSVSALVHVMAWSWICDKPWPEPMLNKLNQGLKLRGAEGQYAL